MKLLDRVAEELERQPAVRFARTSDRIEVAPRSDSGFHVAITADGTVQFEGWHERFANQDEAFNCFMSGLTPKVRLRVTRRGEYDHRWTAEIIDGHRWEEAGTVGLLIFPFWRRKQVIVLQNRWLDIPGKSQT